MIAQDFLYRRITTLQPCGHAAMTARPSYGHAAVHADTAASSRQFLAAFRFWPHGKNVMRPHANCRCYASIRAMECVKLELKSPSTCPMTLGVHAWRMEESRDEEIKSGKHLLNIAPLAVYRTCRIRF